MTSLRGLLALLMVLATPVWAAPLVVRSGEHESFTRLVIQVPQGTGWQLTKGARTAAIAIDVPRVELDTSTVFSRIPKSRLQDVSQRELGAPLQLDLNCNCEVSARLEGGTLLVIDITEGSAEPVILQRMATASNRPQLGFGDRFAATMPGLPTRIGQIAAVADAPERLILPPVPRPAPVPSPAADGVDLPPISRPQPNLVIDPERLAEGLGVDAVQQTEDRLLSQISRAATQGLLRPIDKPTAEEKERKKEAVERDIADVDVRNLMTITSADRAYEHTRVASADETGRVQCIRSSSLDIAKWADDRPFGEQLAELRASLFNELDKANTANVINLAKFYLFHGFGAEASVVLTMLQTRDQTVQRLQALAEVLDEMLQSDATLFAGQHRCATDAAMWSFLMMDTPKTKLSDDVKEASLQAFARLPRHLRRLLGPRLSGQFLSTRDAETADLVLRLIDRSAAEPDAETKLASAAVHIEKGDVTDAKEELADIVVEHPETGPDPLIHLVDTHMQSGQPLDPETVELLASYEVDYRGTKQEVPILRAQVLALGLGQDFEAALAKAKDAAQHDAVQDAYLTVVGKMVEQADDVDFLTLTLQEIEHHGKVWPVPLANGMARRLMGLGFHDMAAGLLDMPLEARKLEERRKMKAEIALHRGLPNRALVELAGLSGAAVEAMRAQALDMAGEHVGAADAYLAVSDAEAAARALWKSGELDRAATSGAGRYQTAAELARGLTASVTRDLSVGPLQNANDLLSGSADTRSQIRQLLDTVSGAPAE